MVLSDAAVFFLFSGWGSLLGAAAVSAVLVSYFYRERLLRGEWRMSVVVAANLFVNAYAVVWPYTSYGLFRLERARVQADFNYNYHFIWCLLSLGVVPLLAFVRMSVSVAHVKELQRDRRRRSN